MDVPGSIRAAAALFVFTGLGFGIPVVPAIRNLAQHRDIPYLFGFPAYGRGPFEQHGLKTTIPLLVAFGLVCAVEILAGALLWSGHRNGAILGLAALPFGAVFWWGFALPIPPLVAAARTVLIVAGWSRLT